MDRERKAHLRRVFFYRNAHLGQPHPLHEVVITILSRYLRLDSIFNAPRAAALLDCDPALFSQDDVHLAVRALWRSDRIGFHRESDYLYENGWISALLRCLSSLKKHPAIVPPYPHPNEVPDDFDFSSLWCGYIGFYQKKAKSLGAAPGELRL